MPLHRILCLLLLLALAAGCGDDAPSQSASDGTAGFIDEELAQFTTADGFHIAGTMFSARWETGRLPVVILLHDRGQDHTLWTPFVPDLIGMGYRVLAIDLRGHGLNVYQNGVYMHYSRFDEEELQRMPLDVEGAIAWLRTRQDVDADRVAVIGTGLGGNIAYVSSGLNPEIRAAVVVSVESRETGTVHTDPGAPEFDPHGVLFVVSYGDGYTFVTSETLAERTRDPVHVTAYQGGLSGVYLLNSETAREEVLDWIREALQ